MAKKQSIKEKREAERAAKIKEHQLANEQRIAKQEETRIEIEEKEKKEKELKRLNLDKEHRRNQKKNLRKSLAKASGLKATFAVGSDLYMTSFGKGNNAIVEKKINGKSVENLTDAEAEIFSVNSSKITDNIIPIISNRITSLQAEAENPMYRKEDETRIQPDKLLLKDTLEKEYFGKTFDDNLHIQIIYNILDIEKILTEYSINTVYTLNNLFNNSDTETNDFIGTLTFQKTFDEYYSDQKNKASFDKFYCLNTLGYFGNVFFENNKKRSKKEVYDIIAIIATIRQWCIHCEDNKRTWIYNAETVLSQEYIDILNKVYSSLIEKINKNFITDNKVNLFILSDVLNMKAEESFNSLVKLYYRFIITKEQKSLGFSIKRIREHIVERKEIKDDKYNSDSVRSKLYKLIDFLLFFNYTNTDSELSASESLIGNLRSSLSDEAKELIYKEEANRVWSIYQEIILDHILPNMDENTLNAYTKDKSLDDKSIENIVEKETSDISIFSKIIYLLAQFINGKEVNDLTTTLVNKFENIQSLIKTAELIGLECHFEEKYTFFNPSKKISTELSVIKNLSNMGYNNIKLKHQMYKDAVDILGINDNISDKEIIEMINTNILFIGADGKPIQGKKGKKGFRNFIISNVIESRRFIYLVKYCNPKKIRKIANNKQLIKFILERIDEKQIKRYYLSCNPEKSEIMYPGLETAIDELTNTLTNIKFDDFKNVDQSANIQDDTKEAKEKMKYQTTITLYLTVCYHLIKNLVNINARYAMACHFLERDARLYATKDPEKYAVCKDEADFQNNLWKKSGELTHLLLSDGPENAGNLYLRNKKWNKLIRENYSAYNSEASNVFRNSVVHLNPIRNADLFIGGIKNITSYFDIYHYIMQKSVLKRLKANNKTPQIKKYEEGIEHNHTYCRDFVKALCIPFAYNLVRYKNLSISGLFDRNESNDSDKTTLEIDSQ